MICWCIKSTDSTVYAVLGQLCCMNLFINVSVVIFMTALLLYSIYSYHKQLKQLLHFSMSRANDLTNITTNNLKHCSVLILYGTYWILGVVLMFI